MSVKRNTEHVSSGDVRVLTAEGVAHLSLTATVRACDLALVDHPRVRVQPEALAGLRRAMTETVRVEGSAPYDWADQRFWPLHEDESVRSQLLTVGNALNFRFWRTAADGSMEALGGWLEGEYFTGSMYLWRRLLLAHAESSTPVADANFLAGIDATAFDDVFTDDHGDNPLIEAVDERIANLRDLGQRLIGSWQGQFHNVLDAASGSLPAFMRLSREFRAFDDRIGKLTLVNALMHRGSGLVVFNEPLLPAIDYQILKQLLRQHVLVPDVVLDSKLRRGEYLAEEEALQLRSAALGALIQIGDESGLPGDVMDNQLWRNRVTCADSIPKCESCKFNEFCSRDVGIQRPLQLTRHY